jgi:hypothetical protein
MPNDSAIGYQKCLITYIDILGFSAMVDSKTPDEIRRQIDLLQVLNRREDNPFDNVKILSFSDTVVRIVALPSQKGHYGTLYDEVISLLHAQIDLIHNGVLARGAMTFGEIYVDKDKDFYFGPGFIKAYNFEKDDVKYPRISLTPAVCQAFYDYPLLRASHHDLTDEIAYLKKVLRYDKKDNQWFIDYINGAASEVYDAENYFDYLLKMKLLIEESLVRYALSPRVQEKYFWLRDYHQKAVEQLDRTLMEKAGYNYDSLLF